MGESEAEQIQEILEDIRKLRDDVSRLEESLKAENASEADLPRVMYSYRDYEVFSFKAESREEDDDGEGLYSYKDRHGFLSKVNQDYCYETYTEAKAALKCNLERREEEARAQMQLHRRLAIRAEADVDRIRMILGGAEFEEVGSE